MYIHPVSLRGEILPPQRDDGHYSPGNSGNPGGVSDAKREMQALARRYSVEAIEAPSKSCGPAKARQFA